MTQDTIFEDRVLQIMHLPRQWTEQWHLHDEAFFHSLTNLALALVHVFAISFLHSMNRKRIPPRQISKLLRLVGAWNRKRYLCCFHSSPTGPQILLCWQICAQARLSRSKEKYEKHFVWHRPPCKFEVLKVDMWVKASRPNDNDIQWSSCQSAFDF